MIRHLPNPALGEGSENPLQVRLLQDETVLWSGQPDKGLVLTAQDIVTIPFSIIWCGFALRGLAVGHALFAPPSLLFGAFGAYFLFGRFILDAWIRRGTSYTITNRRILIERGSPFRKLIAVDRAKLADIELLESASGKGTLRFGQSPHKWWHSRPGIMPSLEQTPQFIKIADARAVFDLLQGSKDHRSEV